MIEYDLPLKEECKRCHGSGYLRYSSKTNIRGLDWVRKPCCKCNGTRYIKLEELEVERPTTKPEVE